MEPCLERTLESIVADLHQTINEPQYCNWQYSYYPFGTYLPLYNNVTQGVKARFTCGHYTLLAHAKVAKWYHEEFKGRHRMTFKNSGNYFEANSTSEADAVSVQRNYDFVLGWFNHGPVSTIILHPPRLWCLKLADHSLTVERRRLPPNPQRHPRRHPPNPHPRRERPH